MAGPKFPRPSLRFRVYPEPEASGRRWYLWVRVWETYADMHAFGRVVYAGTGRYRAVVWVHEKADISGRCIGEMCFALADTTHDVVAHESAHAALHWWRRVQNEPVSGSVTIRAGEEERVVMAVGELTEQVEKRLGAFRAGGA